MRSLDSKDLPPVPKLITLAVAGAICFIALSLCLILGNWFNNQTDRKITPLSAVQAPLRLAESVPSFEIINANGDQLSSQVLHRRWTLLLLLDEGCPACLDSARDWNRLQKRWNGQFQMIGLIKVGWWHAKRRAADFQKKAQISFPCWPDIDGKMAQKLAGLGRTYPAEMLFDPKGRFAMYDDGGIINGTYLSPQERWQPYLEVFIHHAPVPYPEYPYPLPQKVLDVKIHLEKRHETMTLGSLADHNPTLVITLLGSGCHICNQRLSYLSRLPRYGVCHLVLAREGRIVVKDDSRADYDSLGDIFGSADYASLIDALGFKGTPDTLLIQNKNLIGRIYPWDRIPPMLLAVLNQVDPDITQFVRQPNAPESRHAAKKDVSAKNSSYKKWLKSQKER